MVPRRKNLESARLSKYRKDKKGEEFRRISRFQAPRELTWWKRGFGSAASERNLVANKCQPPPGSVAKPCYQDPPIIGIDVASDKQLATPPPSLPPSVSTKEMVEFNKDLHPCIRVIDVHNPTPTSRIVACDFGKKNAPRIVIGLVFQRERERIVFSKGKNKDEYVWNFEGKYTREKYNTAKIRGKS